MTARPQRDYLDPLDRLIKAEEATCKGCIHREAGHPGARDYCGNPLVKQLLADKRCGEYEDTNAG
jgi:hypothetical protein